MSADTTFQMRLRYFLARLIFWLVDVVDGIAQRLGIKICPLTAESILRGLPAEVQQAATNSTIAEPFELFLQDAREDQNTHLLTRAAWETGWRDSFSMGYNYKNLLKYYPDVDKVPFIKPVFLVGMYRSGTTLLQRLLSLDERLFIPRFWEVLCPLPGYKDGIPIEEPGRIPNYKKSQRYVKAKFITDCIHRLFPGLPLVHELGVDFPEECLVLFGQTSISVVSNFEIREPSLNRIRHWFYNMDQRRLETVYHEYQQLIRAIGYKNLGKRRFVSKSHFHALGIKAVLHTFPDAKFIFSYRRLTEAVPSFVKLHEEQSTRRTRDATKDLVERCVHHLATATNRYVEEASSYDNCDQNLFLSYSYSDMLRDPIGIMRRIYKHIDMEFTADIEQKMKGYLQSNPQHQRGKAYSMEKYGLTQECLESRFQPFLKYFLSKGETMENLF